MNADKYTIIVRSMGEQFAEKSIEYAKKAFGTREIFLVQNTASLHEMVRKCFNIGIDNGRKWTVCINADMFLKKESVDYLLNILEYMADADGAFFSARPCMYDYLIERTRNDGPHIYKTDLLEKALKCIDYGSLQPEINVLQKMKDKGYKSYNINITVGICRFINFCENTQVNAGREGETENKNCSKSFQRLELTNAEIDEALDKYLTIYSFQELHGYRDITSLPQNIGTRILNKIKALIG